MPELEAVDMVETAALRVAGLRLEKVDLITIMQAVVAGSSVTPEANINGKFIHECRAIQKINQEAVWAQVVR